MDVDDVKRAEEVSAFLTVTNSEAAYAHAWGSVEGYMNRHDHCKLVLATPGRHEITLFEYVSDFQMFLVSFYKPWTLKMVRALSRAYGLERDLAAAKAVVRSTHRKITELGRAYPRSAKNLLARFYPEHRQGASQLASVQMQEYRSAIRELSSHTANEREEGRLEWVEFAKKLRGNGLPAADTVMDRSGPLITRVYVSTGDVFPSDEFIEEYCTPPQQ